MALSEKSRSALYQGFASVIPDEQAVQEMLSYFPARDVEEPVTKEFLRAEMNDLRAEVAGFRADMQAEFRRMQAWMVGTALTLAAVVVATVALLG